LRPWSCVLLLLSSFPTDPRTLSSLANRLLAPLLQYEDFLETLTDLLTLLKTSLPSQASTHLLAALQDSVVSNTLVILLRLATSALIQEHWQDYEAFLDEEGEGQDKVRRFVQREVEVCGKEADHVQVRATLNAFPQTWSPLPNKKKPLLTSSCPPRCPFVTPPRLKRPSLSLARTLDRALFPNQQIAALSQALSTPIRVAYLDRSSSAEGSEVEVDFHSFDVEGKGTEEGMTLLYRVSSALPSSSTSSYYIRLRSLLLF
jgi:hypothetical protein